MNGALRRIVWRCLAVAILLTVAVSCRQAVEQARHEIGIETVERIERRGSAGAVAVLRVRNDSERTLVLRHARIGVSYGGAPVCELELRDPVRVPRRTTGSVTTLWRLRADNPMALYVLERRIREGDLERIGIRYDLRGRGGAVPVNISAEMMPLSDFLNTFGLSADDLKNYL